MDKKGITLLELLIVVAIIAILAAISVPAYVGQKKKAARTEAFANLEALRVLEEQIFAELGGYVGAGACGKDNDNTAAIQAVLRGFRPGEALQFSYCIQQNINFNGDATTPCFRASAYGNSGTRVEHDPGVDENLFMVDCNNIKNY